MLDSYRELIDELLETPSLVRSLVAAGDSSAMPLIALLHKRDQQMLRRLQDLTQRTEANLSVLEPFETASLSAAAPTSSPEETLASFETGRGDLVSLLMNLTLKDWEREATYDGGGFISLADDVDNHVMFDEAFRHQLGLPE